MLRWVLSLLSVLVPTVLLGGPRMLFDASATAASDWETGQGMTVNVDGGLVFRVAGEPYSWAATKSRFAVEPGAQVTIEQDPGNTPVKVQIEWFAASGDFIAASDCTSGASVGTLSKQLAKPASQMRLKLWLEGDGKQSRLRKLTVTSLIQWREGPVTNVRTLDGSGKLSADAGFIITPGSLIAGTLASQVQFSAVVIEQRLDYSPKAVMMLDVVRIDGDFSLQLLCWDKDAKFIKAVDLLRNVTKSAAIEMPMSIYADQIPAATVKVSFKLWLGGGKTANVQLRSISYAIKADTK